MNINILYTVMLLMIIKQSSAETLNYSTVKICMLQVSMKKIYPEEGSFQSRKPQSPFMRTARKFGLYLWSRESINRASLPRWSSEPSALSLTKVPFKGMCLGPTDGIAKESPPALTSSSWGSRSQKTWKAKRQHFHPPQWTNISHGIQSGTSVEQDGRRLPRFIVHKEAISLTWIDVTQRFHAHLHSRGRSRR